MKFLGLSQNMTSFWPFAVLVQKMNSLLKGTVSHKDPRVVREHIEGGMDQVLFKRCVEEKVDTVCSVTFPVTDRSADMTL